MKNNSMWLKLVLVFFGILYSAMGIVIIITMEPIPGVVNWPGIGWTLLLSGVVNIWCLIYIQYKGV